MVPQNDEPSIIVGQKSLIGRITHVDYIGRFVAVVMPPTWISGPTQVQVIPSVNLGTANAPLVKPGQTIRIVQRSDNMFLGIQIDPPENDCITRLSHLVDYAVTIAQTHKTRDIWWRGQARVGDSGGPWTLVPGAYRKGYTRVAEISNISRFMAKARSRHTSCPPDDSLADWVFLMQHYGLPTRLLDWTESPWVAAFFAIMDEPKAEHEPESDAVIWALNPTKLNLAQIGKPTIVGPMSRESILLLRPAFDISAPESSLVLAISAPEIDPRMAAQLSTFTLHGSSVSLEELQDKSTPLFLHKAIIPGTAKHDLRVELECMGTRLENLYPDLEHLAQALKDKEYWS